MSKLSITETHAAWQSKAMLALFAAATAFAAFAFDTTGYVVLTKADVVGTTESFTGSLPPVGWEDGRAPENGKKYYAEQLLAMPNIGTVASPAIYAFAGDELVLGEGGHIWVRGCADNVVTVANLVMLGGSWFHFGSFFTATYGNCTVQETTRANPAKISSGLSKTRGYWTIELPADLHGDSNQFIATCNTKDNSFQEYAFVGSQADYAGAYLVTTNTSLCLASTSGKVVVEAGGEFCNHYKHGRSGSTEGTYDVYTNPDIASMVVESGGLIDVSKTNVVTVGDLTLKAGAKIKLASDSTTNGLVVVTGSLTVEGIVDVELARTYNTSTGTPQSYRSIILAPGATGTIDPDLFRFHNDPTIVNPRGGLPHVLKKAVVGEDGSVSLVETRKEIVQLLRGYTSADEKTESALWQANNNAGNPFWTNDQAPQSGLDYLCYIRSAGITAPTNSTPVRFVGDSLTFANGTSGYSFQSGSKSPLYGLEVADLAVEDDGFLIWSGMVEPDGASYGRRVFRLFGGTLKLRGTCKFTPFGSDMLLRIESNLTGDGLLRADTRAASANGGPRGWTELTGDNSAWTGKLLVTIDNDAQSRTEEWGSPCPNEKLFASLLVRNERNLGGPLATFAKDALLVNQMCMVRAVDDIDFSTRNRGVMVEREARFSVDEGKTFRIGNQLTLAGVMRKEGAGVLALGGPLRFVDGEAATLPVAMTNRVRLVEGALKPMATNAFDGAEIVVESDAAKFMFDIAPEADGLQAYGLLDTKWATPIVLDGATKVNVELVPPSDGWQEEAHDGYTVGLFTVASQSTAESILSKVSVRKRYPKNHLSLRVSPNDIGSYTVEAVFDPKPGVIISVW